MDQKAKFIIIGLAGILLISFFITLQTLNSKQSVLRERDNLKRETESLTKKAEELVLANKGLEDRVNGLNNDMNRLSQERDELQRRFDDMLRQRDELGGKLQAMEQEMRKSPAVVSMAQPQPAAAPPPAAMTEDAYWSSILKAKTSLEAQVENLRSALSSAKASNEQLARDKGIIESEVANLTQEKNDLESQLVYNQKTLDSLGSELYREKDAKRQLQESLKLVKSENIVLRRQLKGLNSRKADLDIKLAKLQEEKSGLERKFTEMGLLLEDKFSQISELKQKIDAVSGESAASSAAGLAVYPRKESVELPPIVVRPQPDNPGAYSPGSAQGRVISINKDFNFVIVNLGEDDGITVGQMLKVYRGDTPIAGVEVIQVRKGISACDIKNETLAVVAGDTVR